MAEHCPCLQSQRLDRVSYFCVFLLLLYIELEVLLFHSPKIIVKGIELDEESLGAYASACEKLSRLGNCHEFALAEKLLPVFEQVSLY